MILLQCLIYHIASTIGIIFSSMLFPIKNYISSLRTHHNVVHINHKELLPWRLESYRKWFFDLDNQGVFGLNWTKINFTILLNCGVLIYCNTVKLDIQFLTKGIHFLSTLISKDDSLKMLKSMHIFLPLILFHLK
jgi:hypothetical protein